MTRFQSLRFFHLNPEHKEGSTAYIFIEGALNVAVFGLKAEDTFTSDANPPVLQVTGSTQFSIFGTGGIMVPQEPSFDPAEILPP